MPFHVPVFAAVAENPFLARSPWRTPRFHPALPPVALRLLPFSLRSTVPFNRDLRSSLGVFPRAWT